MAEKKTASRAEKAVSEAKKKNPSAGSASKSNSKKGATKVSKAAPAKERLISPNAMAAIVSLGLFVLFVVISVNPDGALLKLIQAIVLGLIGQTDGEAIVVENIPMLETYIAEGTLKLDVPVEVFSQTTKSPAEYTRLCSRLEEMMAAYNELSIERFKGRGLLNIHNTICSQVATRHERLSKFALEHDIIIFVSGKASSNGKVLCDLCKSLNIRTYHIDSVAEIKREWFRADDKVGVCGATSTPKWLLEEVSEHILELNKYVPQWEEKFIN
jgi:hypothetical protein